MTRDALADLSRPIADIQREDRVQRFSLDRLPSIWQMSGTVDYLVDGFLARGSVNLLTGGSGIGKSTLSLQLAGAVAHGSRFLGRDTVPVRTLYVDGENPCVVVRERLERLRIAETPNLAVWGGWCDVAPGGPGDHMVIDWARRHHGLIVFDSLIQFHPGSEQDNTETRQYMNGYRTLADCGATILILHNTGKGENAQEYRGSSTIKDSVDQAYKLSGIGEAGEGVKALRLENFKPRMFEMKPLQIDFGKDGFRVSADTAVRSHREIITDILTREPNRTQRELIATAGAAGLAKQRVIDLLKTGVNEGWLMVASGPKNSTLYRLRDADD